MYRISVERTFCAAHAISISGEIEPVHGHNWHVTLVVERNELDADGLVCDFHQMSRHLDDVLQPLVNSNLNDLPPFSALNPTAEHVAQFIGDSMRQRVGSNVRVVSASVTEAPGCSATYFPE